MSRNLGVGLGIGENKVRGNRLHILSDTNDCKLERTPRNLDMVGASRSTRNNSLKNRRSVARVFGAKLGAKLRARKLP